MHRVCAVQDKICSLGDCYHGCIKMVFDREEAERRVIAARGSSDVPCFDLCVEAELAEMAKEK